ncbi:hypothetical protein IU403_04335 [Aerococcaceae bacterium zg-BR22]|uniref:hypothetical protein n=1 Tax=Aerococcaceae bacterium zg-1292 TaxID=2774330 RepID=UPI00406378B9|nr:hypothetical protein [Aerococcaceae bacterium zg-BR22]
MKNWKKKLVALTATTLLVGGPALSTVSAQETYDKAFFTELIKANQSYSALKFDGTVKVSAMSDGQSADFGVIKYEGRFNADPLTAAFNGTVTSLFLQGKKLEFSGFLKDNIAYVNAPDPTSESAETKWHAVDIATQIEEVKKQYEMQMKQYNELSGQTAELNAKYTDVTETDTEYIVTLKKDINADEFWEDLSKIVDFKKLAADAVKQVEMQTGEKIDDKQREQIESLYSKENIAKFLSWNPVAESHYDKKTKVLTAMHLKLKVNTKDVIPQTDNKENAMEIPETIEVTVDMKFSEHGVKQTIDVPEEALAAEVEKPQMETTTESESESDTDSETETESEMEEETETMTESESETAEEETTEAAE